ncbi:putative ribonuclease H-like domain-containing protein [Tanacetum coccineum]
MNQFCVMNGIKREFSVARTPQQNGVSKRKNRTLIEEARTMLVDSVLPTTYWAEAVSTACYVQNRVLVTKPHNKTPYELLHGRPPSISFMRPFGCPVTILNTLDPQDKFYGKADEGFFVGYSINSKTFRVFNTRTRKVKENPHITFLENKPNVAGSGPDWLFDIDLITNFMNYESVTAGNETNKNAFADDSGKKTNEKPANKGERNGQKKDEGASNKEDDQNVQDFRAALDNLLVQQKEGYANSTNRDSTVSPSVSTAGQSFTNADDLPTDPLMPDLEDTANLLNTGIFSGAYDDEDVGAEADLNNLETTMNVSPIPTTRIHKDHPKDQIIGDINSATQTRRMTKISEELAMVSYIKKQRRTNHKDYQNCLFAYFLSQIEPKKVTQALTDPSWIEAMQDELLQFRLQKVWRLVDLPKGKHAIGTKWVYRNKKDERGIVVRNKARLVAQGYTQEEGIDYDEVFAPVTRIEATRLFLAYASFMGFIVYQMDVKIAFLYGIIEEEAYVCQPPGFEDPRFPDKVYKVEKGSYSLRQAPRAWELTFFLGLQVMQRDDVIFISQDKYVADILKKFNFSSVKTTSTLIETNKALLKDKEDEDVDVHLYISMIGSLMHLTASRPDIMFAVCACDSDDAGASLDRKSITRGCQFLGKRLILWQCKKQTVVANSTTKAEYVAAANCYGHVLWIQNQIDELGVKTGSCKVNATRQDLVLLGENLEFIDQHNMVACLERIDGNAEFHQIVDFLTTSPIHYALTQIHATVDAKTVVISESSVRSDLYFNDEDGITCLSNDEIFVNLALMSGPPKKVGGEAIYTGEDDRVVRAGTTATSLEAEQESDAQTRFETTSKQSRDPPLSEVNTSGSEEDSMEHQDDLTDFVPPTPHDSPLLGGHTLGSDKGRPNINELMAICTRLSNRVLALETSKTAQDLVIKKLKNKVKRLEKKQRARTLGMKLFKIGTSRRKSLDKENVSK